MTADPHPLPTDARSPLLTIAVPTYNRATCLLTVLARLRHEVESLPPGSPSVEVVVVDNASTDGTNQALMQWPALPWLRLIRNPTNIGMDRNFVRCFEVARGRWFWLCSDDDLPVRGSVGTLLTRLNDESFALLYLPTVFKVGDLAADNAAVSQVANLHLEDARSFAARVNGLFTFITCLVVNRAEYVAMSPQPKPDRLVGTYFAHLEWVFALLAHGRSFGAFDSPLVVARSANSGGYDFVRVFTERFHTACRLKLEGRPDLLRPIVDGMRYRHLPKLFFHTRCGANGDLKLSAHDACEALSITYGRDAFYAVVMWPLLHLPPCLARVPLFIARIWGKLWLETLRLQAPTPQRTP